jgi:hypothetical protein
MGGQSRTAEEKAAAIAAGAWGVVTRPELLSAGVTRREIERRVEKGLLIPQHRGVYRVGHSAPSTEARYLAAVKACGEGALLSGRAAAWSWGLLKGSPPAPEVTCPTERKVAGIRTKRRRNMHPHDRTRHKGIPILTVPAVLIDISAAVDVDVLARACHEAGVRYEIAPRHVNAALARRPSAPGAANLRKVTSGEQKVTLSKLEKGFLKLLRENGLPLPETNRPAGTKRVDCRWPGHKLTVELDSYAFHNSRYAWEQDRIREREARGRSEEWRRFSWADVFEDQRYLLGELAELLA